MWHQKTRNHRRQGWVLPDALLAVSIVATSVMLAQSFLQTTHRLEHQRQVQLQRVRRQHDDALKRWLAVQ
ncbi:MAG: hypothetical protein LKH74_11730 [Levilactobacillus sp.]|jgi:type II secretory pathway component PulJ|uniref:hypothetical protein n=1 Tax=Levilactobacillus sp. TaxID=2767919 RepID=UPI00258BE8E4|nr:hypothetical protein [Levilactobacillus sp.]MCH4124382.1 hypothetical protein [Levilactobacillus sp.]MCI1554576.1 hypothetical protein [Levilactobacillus sp.]MCI1599743.1 hypothetical protein [Levilactobacillus sp.]MCI1606437.1 hypothetical protein [Levilactobacillus sp.]